MSYISNKQLRITGGRRKSPILCRGSQNSRRRSFSTRFLPLKNLRCRSKSTHSCAPVSVLHTRKRRDWSSRHTFIPSCQYLFYVRSGTSCVDVHARISSCGLKCCVGRGGVSTSLSVR